MAKKLAINGGPRALSDDRNLRSSWSSKTLERALCEYTGAKYCQLTSSGTAALISGLFAAGCGPGDEVITVAYTWVATAGAILRVNAVPIFADIDPKTFTIDVEDVKRKITPQTKAILPVDFYGHPAPLFELMEIAERHGLTVIEDACQAATGEINGAKLGSIAHFTAFSWSGKPIYSDWGGGAYLTNDRRLYERAMLAGQHPSYIMGVAQDPEVKRYASTGGAGDNTRGVAVNAMAQLLTADARTDTRIRNAEFLTERLSRIKGITPPAVRPGCKHVYHIYNCLWDEKVLGVPRDAFVKALNAEGLWTLAYICSSNYHFTPQSMPLEADGPLHTRAIFQERNLYGKGCPFLCPHVKNPPTYAWGDLPVSEEMARREFSFQQPQLSPPNDRKDMQLIVDVVQKVLDNLDELKE
jgi:dTDP-4-amino-4,6-dideoxygalactose transaminase